MTDAVIDPPSERTCERCGRRDRWDERAVRWTIAVEDGHRLVGDPFCVHEWDVTGDYSPLVE